MLQFFQKTKGSVTIFLVIILVPVIAVCTIFVDASRIKLAQGMAQSSADLALNTVLTQYDEKLSDYYGLMASCQDVEEFYGVSQQYFVDCMVSQGISVTLAQEFAEDITEIVKGNATINDFIAIDQDKTSATIASPANANLANPVMMKEEVIEFMKYRAPIELVGELDGDKKGLVNKLTSVQDKIELMPTETKIEKEKNDYYVAESDLMEKALEVYEALKEYEKFLPKDATAFDKNYMENTVQKNMGTSSTETSLEGLLKDYRELHRKYVSNWANTKNRTEFTSVKTRVSNANISAEGSDVSKDSVVSAIKDCTKKREDFNKAKEKLNTVLSGITFAKADQSTVNHIQYWVQMEDGIVKSSDGDVYGKYTSALIDFLKAKKKMEVYYANRAPRVEMEDTGEVDTVTGLPIMEEVEYDIKDDEFESGKTIESAYNSESSSASSTQSGYTSDSIYNISSYMETYSKEGLNTSNLNNVDRTLAENDIKDALKNIKAEYDDLVEAQKRLKKVIDLLPDVVDLVAEYDKTYDIWTQDVEANKDKMDKSDTIKQDYYEIQKINGNGDSIPDTYQDSIITNESLVRIDINPSDVTDFQNKLQGIWDMLDSYRNAMETVKYRGCQILGRKASSNTYYTREGIYSFAQFESAAKGNLCSEPAVDTEQIPVIQTELDAYIEQTWNITWDYTVLTDITEGKSGNSPLLHTSDWKNDSNIAIFDSWLHAKFPNDEPTLEETKGILKKFKEMMKQLKESATANFGTYTNFYKESEEISGKSNLPSNGVTANTEQLFSEDENDDDEDSLSNTLDSSSSVGGLFDKLDFATLLTDGRDNLYTVEYIMNMFSYETTALEQLYLIKGGGTDSNDIYKMSDGNRISPKTAKDYYDTPLKETASESAKWWNTKKTFTDNKSLTNKMMDKDNNISYGNEVEYILYGGTNEENHSKIDTSLFFIRYALNLGPILQEYWNDSNVNNIASGIAGITQGIIPAPLVKLIIVLGVDAAESAVDRNYLLAGLPVAFYKNKPKEQLFIQLKLDNKNGFVDAVRNKNTDYASSIMETSQPAISESIVSFSYSEYISTFLFIELCTAPDDIYKRTADVIQTTMAQDDSEFVLSKSLTYYTIETKVRVKPMMMTLPYAQQSGVTVTDTDTWNTFEYKTSKGY